MKVAGVLYLRVVVFAEKIIHRSKRSCKITRKVCYVRTLSRWNKPNYIEWYLRTKVKNFFHKLYKSVYIYAYVSVGMQRLTVWLNSRVVDSFYTPLFSFSLITQCPTKLGGKWNDLTLRSLCLSCYMWKTGQRFFIISFLIIYS